LLSQLCIRKVNYFVQVRNFKVAFQAAESVGLNSGLVSSLFYSLKNSVGLFENDNQGCDRSSKIKTDFLDLIGQISISTNQASEATESGRNQF
jgi:hypothetical protein